jgi:hypothetical protein
MERAGIRSPVWYLGVIAASFVGALVSSMSTILLFVIVGEALFYFLSLCFTALVAALCAVFVGDALAANGRRVRLWSVVGVSEIAGILASLANLAFVDSVGNRGGLAQISLGQQMDLSAIFVALVSGVAAWGLRRPPVTPGTEAPKDAISAVLLILLALILLIAAVVFYDISNPVV